MSSKIMEADQPLPAIVSDLLQEIPLFSGLSEHSFAVLSECFIAKKYPKNTVIFNEGEEPTSMYLILSGGIEEYVVVDEGKEIITDVKSFGQYFGELALTGESSQKYSVRTIEDTELAILAKQDFEELSSQPEIARQLVRGLIGQVRGRISSSKSLGVLTTYGRLANILLDLSEEMGGKRDIDKKLAMREITGGFGVATGMIRRLLKELEIDGYITIEEKKIVINEKLY